jgi:8-oxo-dGTP pyrophosphatase MutT (NUDIX family)
MADSKNSRRKPRQQVGALPFRRDKGGDVQVMLVTSRGTRRWVIPKGNPIKGLKIHRSAEREAFEEAGVLGRISKKPVGRFAYEKHLKSGATVPCEVAVFALQVEKQRKHWPEMAEREWRWFSPDEAAAAVAERDLHDLLLAFRSRHIERRVRSAVRGGTQGSGRASSTLGFSGSRSLAALCE